MLEFDGLNYWAIAVAWLVSVVVGAFWYSPAGFGKQWTRLSGVDHMKIPEGEATRILVAVSLSAVVQAVVLAVVVRSLDITTAGAGLLAGILLWLGLTAATSVGGVLYQRLGWKFWWLSSSYFLLTLAVNATILAIW